MNLKKKGLFEIYQYVKREVRGWEKIDIDLPPVLENSKNDFELIKEDIEYIIENYSKDEYMSILESQWQSVTRKVNELARRKRLPITHPKTKFLIELLKISEDYFQGGYNYFLGKSSLSFSNKEQFSGVIMSYEFDFEESLLPKRRNSEKSSLTQVRNAFENYFGQTEQRVNSFLENAIDSNDKNRKNLSDFLSEKKGEYNEWISQCKKDDQKYSEYQLKRTKDLEELYQEKLKLEAPAKYWKDRAFKLRKEGDRWLYWLIGVTICAVLALGAVLYFISDGTLKDLFEKTGSAVRWSIVFITFVSFLAYAIRTFAKLMFSAYHLHRDAEEREQLAYVYLALKKEQGIDDTERHLIMQSIFSRADSGLLRDDSSPTMPGGGLIEKFMGKN